MAAVTDATSVALTGRHGIDRVPSLDDDVDGVGQRIDPGNV